MKTDHLFLPRQAQDREKEPSPKQTAYFCSRTDNTLLGNKTLGYEPMSKEEILSPFVRSFATDEPAEGGCVDWHPPAQPSE
jgi:hypothetical protein|eukprot:COSAG06_NODE_2173_length_7416_cov_3.697827_8_plen_81_part_00